ncbi:MAG: hypothetical protein ACRDAM_02890, partial [Casimicrobium sp.]
MTASSSNLRLIGHFGEIGSVKKTLPGAMFLLDANLLLTLLQCASKPSETPPRYREFLLTIRARVRLQWHERERFIPVNAVLAALELSKQDTERDYNRYLQYFQSAMLFLFQIDNVDPRWIEGSYLSSCRLMDSSFLSTERTVGSALMLMPATSTSNDAILESVDTFCRWIETSFDSLAFVGGPSLFVPILAFCG